MERALGLEATLVISLGMVLVVAWVMGRPLSLVGLRVGSWWSLGTVRLCLELPRGLVNREGGMLRRLLVWLLSLVVTAW